MHIQYWIVRPSYQESHLVFHRSGSITPNSEEVYQHAMLFLNGR